MLAELAGIAELVSRCRVGNTLFSLLLYAEIARADRECPRRERFCSPRLDHVFTGSNLHRDNHPKYEIIQGEDGFGEIVRYTEDSEEYDSLGRIDE